MLPPLMKVVKVKKTGKVYTFREKDDRFVKTYGDPGGPDKKFRLSDVEIYEVERPSQAG